MDTDMCMDQIGRCQVEGALASATPAGSSDGELQSRGAMRWQGVAMAVGGVIGLGLCGLVACVAKRKYDNPHVSWRINAAQSWKSAAKWEAKWKPPPIDVSRATADTSMKPMPVDLEEPTTPLMPWQVVNRPDPGYK